jgi:hypothetical protein
MSKRYETGTKKEVLAFMAACAIRDQRDLIDAHTPPYGQPCEASKEVIRDCRAIIRDFKKLAGCGITAAAPEKGQP